MRWVKSGARSSMNHAAGAGDRQVTGRGIHAGDDVAPLGAGRGAHLVDHFEGLGQGRLDEAAHMVHLVRVNDGLQSPAQRWLLEQLSEADRQLQPDVAEHEACRRWIKGEGFLIDGSSLQKLMPTQLIDTITNNSNFENYGFMLSNKIICLC